MHSEIDQVDEMRMENMKLRCITAFKSLLQTIDARGESICSLLQLQKHEVLSGATFRYDIHARDIAGAHIFAGVHREHGIPGVFYLQLDYSSLERDRAEDFEGLARTVRDAGAELGLHASPADSYFIWRRFGGHARAYAQWLRQEGAAYFIALAREERARQVLDQEIFEHFQKEVDAVRKVLGDVTLVAAHGGELGQMLRPLLGELEDVAPVISNLFSHKWMTPERLSQCGIVQDAEQRQGGVLQFSDSGGGYPRLSAVLGKHPAPCKYQLLIHPFGWNRPDGAAAAVGAGTGGATAPNPQDAAVAEEKRKARYLEMVGRTRDHWLAVKAGGAGGLEAVLKQQLVVSPVEPTRGILPFHVLDLCPPDENCHRACGKAHEKWMAWCLRTFKNRTEEHHGRTYSVPSVPMAVLDMSLDEPAYRKRIGDKSRNMLRKAEKNGYTVRRFDSKDHLDGIHAIRLSKEFRCGKPVPDSFRVYPTPFDAGNGQLCDRHKRVGIGVFKDETLVAYTAVHICGDLAIINTILGHGDHLKFGVMNLLISGVFTILKADYPGVKFVNYLTLHSSTKELDTFKRSVGFDERAFGVELPRAEDEPLQPDEEALPVGAQALSAPGTAGAEPGGAAVNVPLVPGAATDAQVSGPGQANRFAELLAHGGIRKILVRGDCCAYRCVAQNPEIFGRATIIQSEKCTTQVYLDHIEGLRYDDKELERLCRLDDMAPSLRRYYLNQNKAAILFEKDADLLVIDCYADMFFQIWKNRKTGAKLWVNAKYLHDRDDFERKHVKLPQKSFHEVLLDTIKIIEHVRSNNPGIPVLYLTHPIHYYPYLARRREFSYLGNELERYVPDLYWGGHLPKEGCEPVDLDSCGPGETQHYTPATYAKMVGFAAARQPTRTLASPATRFDL